MLMTSFLLSGHVPDIRPYIFLAALGDLLGLVIIAAMLWWGRALFRRNSTWNSRKILGTALLLLGGFSALNMLLEIGHLFADFFNVFAVLFL